MAQRGVNKVILIGRLGQDPEIRYANSGTAIANLSIATSETWRDKATGEQKEKTEWHRVVIFGKLAEIAGEYLKKGSEVYIEGALQTRKWTDNAGVEKYTTEIVLQPMNGTMQMIGVKPKDQQSAAQTSWGKPQQPTPQQMQPTRSGPPVDYDDSIPF